MTEVGQDAEVRRWVRELQAEVAVEENSRRLFTLYYPWVRGFFARRGFPPREAEDLAQDTFFQVFHRIAQYREESTFEGWLFAIAANVSRNELRRRGTDKRLAEEVPLTAAGDEDRPEVEIADSGPSPERRAFEKERRRALREAVGNLPAQMRRCLLLRLERELKYREIATLLKLSIETVKAHLFFARQRLKDDLGEEVAEWID